MIGIPYRHTFLSLILACLSAACNSPEPQEQPVSSPMTFGAGLGSRANVTGNDNITAAPFVVYSDMTSMSPSSESSFITIHDATEVSYSDGQWSYNNTKYWFPGFQYSFVAFHPAGTRYLTGFEYSKNRLEFRYTQPAQYQNAPDLLISAHRCNYAGGDADPVCFDFVHILTNVNILVTYEAPSSGPGSITINNLTFKNIPTESTYSIQPAPLTGDSEMTTDWVNDEDSHKGWSVNGRSNLGIDFSGLGKPRTIQANKEAARLFTDSDALLLLPNPYDPDSPAELELNYTTNTGEGKNLSATIPRGWDPGTSLTLSLKITHGLVQFSVSIEEWKDGSTTDTTVPRK